MIIYVEDKNNLTEEQIEKIKLVLDYEHNASTVVIKELLNLSRELNFKFSINLNSLKDILNNLSKEEIDILENKNYNIADIFSYKNKSSKFNELTFLFLCGPNFNIRSLPALEQASHNQYKYAICKNKNDYVIVNNDSVEDIYIDQDIFNAFSFNKSLTNK